jgi:AhpD family alkylhydroperoxidase
MQARITNTGALIPEILQALMALSAVVKKDYGVPERTLGLMHLRASQINGCSVCVDMHAHDNKETNERLLSVAAWRDAPYFTDAERAALALTEAATRLADRPDPVPDEIWNEAARHYNEKELSVIVVHIALTNLWNRINVPTRQVAGEWLKSAEAQKWLKAQKQQDAQQPEPAIA